MGENDLKWKATEEMKGDHDACKAAVAQDRLPHVASPKLPNPLLVAGAGRKHLPDDKPKPQTKW